MFPIVLLGAKTKTGLELALKCVEFSGTESVNSNEPILNFKYAVLAQSVEPFRNVENPSLEDYYYEKLSEGFKSYSNQTLRVDLEIVNGVPTPIFEQAKDEFDNLLFEEDGVTPIMIPKMIGNIDFWLKFGGNGIIADLYFTVGQIKQEPLETFYKG
jgi:hypothetical protein